MHCFDFEHGGQRRSFAATWPDNFASIWGEMHLMVGLHASYESMEDFWREVDPDGIGAGRYGTLGGGLPRMVFVFPRALSHSDQLKGQFNTGVMGLEGMMLNVDDTGCIIESVALLNDLLKLEVERLLGFTVTGTFYEKAKFLLVGKECGGQLAYFFQAAVQTRVLPASIAARGLVPNTIAIAGTSAGGAPFWDDLNNVPNPDRPGRAALQAFPGAEMSNLLHIHSTADERVDIFGGVSRDAKERTDYLMGGDGNGFYRWDIGPGPADHTVADPTASLAGKSIEPWVTSLAATAPPVYEPKMLPPGVVGWQPYTRWTWSDSGGGYAVSFVLYDETSSGTGNLWPNSAAGFDPPPGVWSPRMSWDATRVVLEFFEARP